ncbi:MAG: hypothetical protein WC683_05825 [bacterium]
MPIRSEAQRRYLWANHPEIAKRWEEHTNPNARLPEHVPKKTKQHRAKMDHVRVSMRRSRRLRRRK